MKTTLAALISLPVLILSPAAAVAQKEISASDLMERLTSMAAEVPPPPRVTEAEVVELEEGDPETYIFIKEAKAHPPEPENLGGDGVISLTRLDTGETLTARYRRRGGSYSRKALARISGLMRCSLTGRETQIAVKLVELLDAVEDRFGGRGISLLSGYRTPRFNGSVPGAARRSLHMLGWAADITVPGQSPDSVAEYATSLRTGGVGRYPDAGFTHLDAGRARYWTIKGSSRHGTRGKER